jgi:Na+-driven multidrug efflux pump
MFVMLLLFFKQTRPIIKFETTFKVNHNVKFKFILIEIVKAGLKIVLFQCSYSFTQFVILMICHHTKLSVHSYVASWVMMLKGSIELSVPVCYVFSMIKWLTRLVGS